MKIIENVNMMGMICEYINPVTRIRNIKKIITECKGRKNVDLSHIDKIIQMRNTKRKLTTMLRRRPKRVAVWRPDSCEIDITSRMGVLMFATAVHNKYYTGYLSTLYEDFPLWETVRPDDPLMPAHLFPSIQMKYQKLCAFIRSQ